MPDSRWSEGYVIDTDYADKLHQELAPGWLNYVAVLNGFKPVNLRARFRYLELGCGFGHSIIENAAKAPSGDFFACDFIASHIASASTQTRARGINNLELKTCSFQDLLTMNIGRYDFIVLHGIYSWVGAEARKAVRSIINKYLKPGGLVYVSYNCLPGWTAELPLRRLLLELAETKEGDTAERASQALEDIQALQKSKLRYFESNPSIGLAIESYARTSAAYLAHEFLNQTWEPYYSVDITDEMKQLGLTFVGSATLADNHEMLLVENEQAKVIAHLQTARLRQLAMDFAVNRSFRRDVFNRLEETGGPQSQPEISRHIRSTAIQRAGTDNINAIVQVPRGEISFQESFVEALNSLVTNQASTIGEVVTELSRRGHDQIEITRNLIFLIAAGELIPHCSGQSA